MVELRNVEFARRLRRYGVVAGALFAAGLIVVVAGGEITWALIGPYLVAFHATYAWMFPKWFGSILAQPYLRADATGLHYGPKYHVTWDEVEGIETQRGAFLVRDHDVVVVPRWSRKGYEAWIARRRGLPLSAFDREWRANPALEDLLRRTAGG